MSHPPSPTCQPQRWTLLMEYVYLKDASLHHARSRSLHGPETIVFGRSRWADLPRLGRVDRNSCPKP